jgi:transposase InsO family protein
LHRTAGQLFAFLESLKAQYPLDLLCEALGLSRSGYYAWKKRPPSARRQSDQELTRQIGLIYHKSRRTYGSPRIRQELRKEGLKVGRRRISRLMRQSQISGRSRRRRRPRTTDSRHGGPIAPHRLKELAAPKGIDQIWVGDLTYVQTGEGWLYVAAFLDLYSRRVVGWAASHCLDSALCLLALQRALRLRRPSKGLIVHTDRGVQYASREYRAALQKHGLIASMSRKANCYDNAHMESFWSTLKADCIEDACFATRAQADHAIFDYIETFYNARRSHSSLAYQSPRQFEQCSPQTAHHPPHATASLPACHNHNLNQ